MQEQQPTLNLLQRFQVAMQVQKIFRKASGQDSTALQVEDVLVKSFEQVHISEETIQAFRDRLEKVRQRVPHGYLEETYIMGGILIYCSILLSALISLGIPDFPSRLAWIAFAFAFPSAVGFFVIRFLKERNSISSYGSVHGFLAFLAEIGILAMTAGLFFHVWNVVGWLFLFWTMVIILGYIWYRFMIYFMPLLASIKDILKSIDETAQSKKVPKP